jgi:ABC-type glycerol-3-phosphate transport system substrate-binding protein
MKRKAITRRDFLVSAGAVAGAAVLTSCGTNPTATPVVQTVVKQQTSVVEKVVTATPVPTKPPAPAVMDIWWNSDIDLAEAAKWKNDANNDQFKKMWYWGGLANTMYPPFIQKHPGVTLKIATHSWDSELRQNQMMALAAGIIPDVTYGEAYVNEFVQLGIYNPVSAASVALFPTGPVRGATVGGKVYGLPMSSGADVLFINLTLWKKAELDPTKLPKTWDELKTACQAISKINKSDKWGNTCYYTYGPSPTYGTAMRILHWFNQIDAPLGDDLGKPSANAAKAVDAWAFHNDLMWSSTEALILQSESEGGSGKLFNDGVIAVKPGWNNDATSVGAGNVDAAAIPFPTPPGGHPATILIGNQINSPLKSGKNPDLAIALVEETLTREDTQAFLSDNAGIWIPALKSQLQQYATFDKLAGYKTDTAKKMVRVTMQALLEGNAAPLPGWPKNGDRVWNEWNNTYQRIWKGKLAAADIKKELDTLQTTIEGLLVKTG